MATIDVEDVFPNEQMRRGVSYGAITQIHHGKRHAEEGDRFELDGDEFEVVEVKERTLGDLTDEDARAAGMDDLEEYREVLERARDDYEWDPDNEVVLHRVEKR